MIDCRGSPRQADASPSWGHLAAVFVGGAAALDRAGAAVVVAVGLEDRAGHSAGDAVDELAGPLRVLVGGRRGLGLYAYPRREGGLADLDQLGAAGLDQAPVGERAEHHRELVHPQLRVACQVLLAYRGGGGLDVDDPGASLAVALRTVDPAADLHPAQVEPERLLDGDD